MKTNCTSGTRLTSRFLEMLAILTVAAPAMLAKAQSNPGTLNYGGESGNASYSPVTINGITWGQYYVDHYERTTGLSPRVERYCQVFTPTSAGTTWQGTMLIADADNTTVFQILNYNPSRTDTSIPQLFTRAYTDGSGNPSLYLETGTTDVLLWSGNVGESVVAYVKSYYRSASGKMLSQIRMNGILIESRLLANLDGNNRNRYGAYHHGHGHARILFRDVTCVNN